MNKEYGSDQRYGRTFGERSLVGDNGDIFFSKTLDEQAIELAWSEGCPIKDKVIKKKTPLGARNGYGEVIFANQIILHQAKIVNPELYQQLSLGLERNYGEQLGEHEPQSVPTSHIDHISASNTPWGYSLPRILLEARGRGEEKTQERFLRSLYLLEQSLKESDSSLQFIAIFAEKVVKDNPLITNAILKQAFSNGSLNEENFFKTYEELFVEIKNHSPILYEQYKKLSVEKRAEYGIAQVITNNI